jgi:prevent-host-death family protein
VFLTGEPDIAILVGMTSLSDDMMLPLNPRTTGRPDYWPLQDTKARFSELVRKARNEGPQHVTVHGRDEVVVIAAEEFPRLSGNLTGAALIAVVQSSPHREIEIESARMTVPVRDVTL